MMTTVVFETHSWSEDNESGIATGWLPGRLSERGRAEARRLGERRRDEPLAAVISSDLERAAETVRIAFGQRDIPILFDWHLRECNYGRLNGRPTAETADRLGRVDNRYPGGESWGEAVCRTRAAIADIVDRWPDERVLVVGHMATHYGCLALAHGTAVADLVGAPFNWQPGWVYSFCNGA
jgi:broad specificity phosphatase PhoE